MGIWNMHKEEEEQEEEENFEGAIKPGWTSEL
jgi:hypothetical protein